MRIEFSVIGTPIPQGSMKALSNRKTGRTMLISDNPKLKAWRELVAIRARCAMSALEIREPMTGAVRVTAIFTFQKPASVRREHHTVKPDIDKLIRAINDAMTSIVFVDDSQVVRIEASKNYGLTAGVLIVVQDI